MRLVDIVSTLGLLAMLQPALAFPAMNSLSEVIQRRKIEALQRRQDADVDLEDDGDDPPVVFGDLKTGATTPVGQSIYNILMRTEAGTSSVAGYKPPGFLGSKACKADVCCPYYYLSTQLTFQFTGITGRCNDLARAAIRLGFHDAGTWSVSNANSGQDFGGADGSIALDGGAEIKRAENKGLEIILSQVKLWQPIYGVGMADLIQFAAIHATVTCPLGPRTRFFVGRKDSKKSAPNGLLPDVKASAESLISLFQDKTISPHDLVALLGAHSTSKQFAVDPSKLGQPQDTTPGVWDVSFYNQTVQTSGPKNVFKFDSDVKISKEPRASVEWQKFMDPVNGQSHWTEVSQIYSQHFFQRANNKLTHLCNRTMPVPMFASASSVPTT